VGQMFHNGNKQKYGKQIKKIKVYFKTGRHKLVNIRERKKNNIKVEKIK
jgi:hypothetical protein